MTGNDVLIRPMRCDDDEALADLLRRIWHDEGDPRVQAVVARADWESCLARTTVAAVAELDGRPVGVMLGRIDGTDTRTPFGNRHLHAMMRAMATLLGSGEGRRAAAMLMDIGMVNAGLLRQARRMGRRYQAEAVLFILEPDVRGHGVGRQLYDWLMDRFRAAGVRDYFLYTDTSCDVGFYDHRGLTRRAERRVRFDGGEAVFYLYDGVVPGER